jgi:hypothetical protein
VAEEARCFLEAQEALDREDAAKARVYVQRIIIKRDKHGRSITGRMKLSHQNVDKA